jgi:hypothetical protein
LQTPHDCFKFQGVTFALFVGRGERRPERIDPDCKGPRGCSGPDVWPWDLCVCVCVCVRARARAGASLFMMLDSRGGVKNKDKSPHFDLKHL